MDDLIQYYFYTTLGWVEIVSTICLLICVYLAVVQNIWTWAWGTIGVILFGYLVYEFQLYSDAALQFFFYLPLQFVGWYWWKTKGPKSNDDLPVISLSGQTVFMMVLAIVMLTVSTGFFMERMTDASFPYADAFTTWLSIFAQILMIKKIWESWHLWVTMDAVAIFIYYAKGLYVISGLYVIFFILASMGLIAWYKSMKHQEAANAVV